MAAVFVSGFDFDTPESAIESHFGTVGPVSDVRLQGSGNAVVTFESVGDAQRAVDELHSSTIEGNKRWVAVRLDKGKGKGKGEGKGKGKGKSDKGGYGGKGDYDGPSDFDGELLNGTVANFIEDRGFGFIAPDDGGDDVYCHFSSIQSSGFRTLSKGQPVQYGLGTDSKGKGKGKSKAVHVVPL